MAPIQHLFARSDSDFLHNSVIGIVFVVIIGIFIGLAVLGCCIRASRVKSTPMKPLRQYSDGGLYGAGTSYAAERSRTAREHNRNHYLALYSGTDAAILPPPPAYTPGGYAGHSGAAAFPSYAAATSGVTGSGGAGRRRRSGGLGVANDKGYGLKGSGR